MKDGERNITAAHAGWLILILAAGLWLRTVGFSWGLPTPEFYQTQTFYPDEQLVFITLKGMNPSRLEFRPSKDGALLGLGPFYAYLVGATVWAAEKAGFVRSTDNSAEQKPVENVRKLYQLGRAVNVALALLTIVAVFLFASRIRSANTGLLTALIVALLPIHVYFSQTMARDISQLFFWTASLLFLSRVKRSDENLFPALAGLCLGFSAACKYSSLLLCLSLPVALWLPDGGEKPPLARFLRSKTLLFALAGIPAGYLIGNPYSLLAFHDFAAEFAVSLRAVGGLQGSDAFQAGGGWKFFGLTAWVYGAGTAMAAVFAFGFVRALFRRDRWDWILLAAAVPYLAVNMASNARFVRYLMPLIPLAAYWSARLVSDMRERSFRNDLPAHRHTLVISALWIVLALTARYSWNYAGALNVPDTRITASEWIRDYVPDGASIGTASTPYFHHPSRIGQQFWHPGTIDGAMHRIVNLEFSRDRTVEQRPDYIVLSDYDYFPLETMSSEAAQAHPRWGFLEYVARSGEYSPIRRFEEDISFDGSRGDRPFFPHDWRYPFPTIVVFQRSDLVFPPKGRKPL